MFKNEKQEDNEFYSFNEILKSNFVELSNKNFVRIDNGECLGLIWGKYNSNCGLNSIANDGIIEFISKDGGKINKVYGYEIDKDGKLFKVFTTNQKKI